MKIYLINSFGNLLTAIETSSFDHWIFASKKILTIIIIYILSFHKLIKIISLKIQLKTQIITFKVDLPFFLLEID